MGYKGVRTLIHQPDVAASVPVHEVGDGEFISRTVQLLKKHDITVVENATKMTVNTALPDVLDEFKTSFIKDTSDVKNMDKFKRRILGLTSYFRSAQEELLPKYDPNFDTKVILIPMSDYQFSVYESYRVEERKSEKTKPKKDVVVDNDGLFEEPKSTYRIFSRLACNFVMPVPPGRPMPKNASQDDDDEEDVGHDAQATNNPKEGAKQQKKKKRIKGVGGKGLNLDEDGDASEDENGKDNPDIAVGGGPKRSVRPNVVIPSDSDFDALFKTKQPPATEEANPRELDELEGDELLDQMGDVSYSESIKSAIEYLRNHSRDILSTHALKTYSPKFLAMYENIVDDEHQGLHLVYSQFRTMEGIGIFAMTLEANGFARFKIRRTTNTGWELNMSEEDMGKPTYALYTGTEDAEEREIIRNIYNGTWEHVPTNITQALRRKSNNNNLGEIIKVIMITSAGSEGINLRNTRYVHIMEPYWHPVRTEQVIGRARRICSHQDLPKHLQTVNVFIYIMRFTDEQLDSEYAIELRLKDLSKRPPYVPQTSDQKLLEISTIKHQLTSQILTNIKESSIDCATYSKSNSKEGLKCITFGQPNADAFTYNPNYKQDENDATAVLNKKTIQWEGQKITDPNTGNVYVLRKETQQVYDYESVQLARTDPRAQPILLGKLVKNEEGVYEIVRGVM